MNRENDDEEELRGNNTSHEHQTRARTIYSLVKQGEHHWVASVPHACIVHWREPTTNTYEISLFFRNNEDGKTLHAWFAEYVCCFFFRFWIERRQRDSHGTKSSKTRTPRLLFHCSVFAVHLTMNTNCIFNHISFVGSWNPNNNRVQVHFPFSDTKHIFHSSAIANWRRITRYLFRWTYYFVSHSSNSVTVCQIGSFHPRTWTWCSNFKYMRMLWPYFVGRNDQ